MPVPGWNSISLGANFGNENGTKLVANPVVWSSVCSAPARLCSSAPVGEKAMAPLLSEMSSPVMRSVYGSAKLEDDEQFAVKAYLADLERTGAFPRKDRDFVALGVPSNTLSRGVN